jgi:hypothetical protein
MLLLAESDRGWDSVVEAVRTLSVLVVEAVHSADGQLLIDTVLLTDATAVFRVTARDLV